MSKHITNSSEQIWNERFEKRMKELGLSQREFIKKYKDRYGTGSQSDVSNWMHIGDMDGNSKKARNFPEFKTMQRIASILEVSVSYLIGESDYESYDVERASNYLGLSAYSIKSICGITSGKSIPPFNKYPDQQITSALELMLCSSALLEHLQNLGNLIDAKAKEQSPKNHFERAVKKIPSSLQKEAVELWSDPENAVKNLGIIPSEELQSYVQLLDDAVDDDMAQLDKINRDIKALRYALQESNIKIIDDILEKKAT